MERIIVAKRPAIKEAVINSRDFVRVAEREVLDAAAEVADEYHEDAFLIRLTNSYLTLEVVKPPRTIDECRERGYVDFGFTNAAADAEMIAKLPSSQSRRVRSLDRVTDLTIDDFNHCFYRSVHGD